MFDVQVDPVGLTDDELAGELREASAAVNRAQAHRMVVAAEWDRRQVWANDGAYNGRCCGAHHCDHLCPCGHPDRREVRSTPPPSAPGPAPSATQPPDPQRWAGSAVGEAG